MTATGLGQAHIRDAQFPGQPAHRLRPHFRIEFAAFHFQSLGDRLADCVARRGPQTPRSLEGQKAAVREGKKSGRCAVFIPTLWEARQFALPHHRTLKSARLPRSRKHARISMQPG